MKRLYVEQANTPLKREQGLMGRKKMGQNHGMLFDFHSPRRLSFWMRNTYIPLDIAFLDNEGVIEEIKEMTPMSTRPVTSHNRCRYALEVNRGWFRDNNITEGSSISGVGIQFKNNTHKVAQMTPMPMDSPPVEPGLQPPLDTQMAPQQESFNPTVVLDRTYREMLEDANAKGKDLIMMYRIKERLGKPPLTIGPKVISPPFIFGPNAEGESNAIVKAWDSQDAGWKDFLIDNILDLEEKEPPQESEEKVNSVQDFWK